MRSAVRSDAPPRLARALEQATQIIERGGHRGWLGRALLLDGECSAQQGLSGSVVVFLAERERQVVEQQGYARILFPGRRFLRLDRLPVPSLGVAGIERRQASEASGSDRRIQTFGGKPQALELFFMPAERRENGSGVLWSAGTAGLAFDLSTSSAFRNGERAASCSPMELRNKPGRSRCATLGWLGPGVPFFVRQHLFKRGRKLRWIRRRHHFPWGWQPLRGRIFPGPRIGTSRIVFRGRFRSSDCKFEFGAGGDLRHVAFDARARGSTRGTGHRNGSLRTACRTPQGSRGRGAREDCGRSNTRRARTLPETCCLAQIGGFVTHVPGIRPIENGARLAVTGSAELVEFGCRELLWVEDGAFGA